MSFMIIKKIIYKLISIIDSVYPLEFGPNYPLDSLHMIDI